jgi:hypothetical protein
VFFFDNLRQEIEKMLPNFSLGKEFPLRLMVKREDPIISLSLEYFGIFNFEGPYKKLNLFF